MRLTTRQNSLLGSSLSQMSVLGFQVSGVLGQADNELLQLLPAAKGS